MMVAQAWAPLSAIYAHLDDVLTLGACVGARGSFAAQEKANLMVSVHGDGAQVHYVLQVDPSVPGSRTTARRLPDSPHGRREMQGIRLRHVMAWKRTVWSLTDELGTEV